MREHPEVPLSEEQRDTVLLRMGYHRTGPWATSEDGDIAGAAVTET
ncbi:hypothetical protein [Streptomyces sp. B29(2018)]|nr:hypothetical protein [Streptomyces sp. B29(2018)]